MVLETETGREFLEHYGTKGMKWGVRKSRSGKIGSSSDSRSAERKRVDELLKKPRKSLTNQELQDVANRMNLETQVSRLTEGKSFAKKLLSGVNTANTTVAALKSPVGKAIVGAGAAAAIALVRTGKAVGTIGQF